MTTVNPATQFTPEDLLRLEGGDSLYELVDGTLAEKNTSSLSGATTIIISARLYEFINPRKLGTLYSESTFMCFPKKPNQVRRPDIAFICSARLAGVPREGHIPIHPDLAIEVVSQGDDVSELDQKLQDYKSAGIPLVWILNPNLKTVAVHRPHQPTIKLRTEDQIGGEGILPGFSAKVRELFPQE